MKNKLAAILGLTALLTANAFALPGDGFSEATTIANSADTLIGVILPIVVSVVGIGIALSVVKMVKKR
jgi:hypothetical protein